MEKKQDLRIIKTHNLLYNTLINLLKDKSFEEIKVSDICSNSLINRSTFYAHYNDKYELLVDLINNFEEELNSELSKNQNLVNTKEFYIESIKLILDYIEKEKKTFQSILIKNRNSIVADIIINTIKKDVYKRFSSEEEVNKEIPIDIISEFYIGAVSNVCINWLENNNKYTKEEIVNYFNLLIPDYINKN